MNAIETKALCKRYGERLAVNELNLTVHQGERFALLGVNGAGKTTTVKLLTGLLLPSAGEAEVLGYSLTKENEQIKRRVGVSPQETAVAPNLTVQENLELIAGIFGKRRNDAKAQASKIIAAFGLQEFAAARAKTLSGGWQRRLSIAMALIGEPELLFLDEPTLGLDVLARRALWEVIRSLHMTLILTTHYMEEAEQLADHVGIMSGGRLLYCGTPKELIEKTGASSFEEAFVRMAGGETA